jgi:hypothetical protein
MESAFILAVISFLFLSNTVFCTESSVLRCDEDINTILFGEQGSAVKRKRRLSALTLNIVNTTSEYADSCCESDIFESLNSIFEKVNSVIEKIQEKKFSFELPKIELRCTEVDYENNKTKSDSKFEMICLAIEKIEKILIELENLEKNSREIVGELFIFCNNLINNIQTIYLVVEKREENGLINTKSFDDVEKSLKKLTKITLIDFKQIFETLSIQKEKASEMIAKINNMCVKQINNTSTILESHEIQEKVLLDLNNAYNDLHNDAQIIVNKNWEEKCLVFQIRSCNIMLSKWIKNMEKEYRED